MEAKRIDKRVVRVKGKVETAGLSEIPKYIDLSS